MGITDADRELVEKIFDANYLAINFWRRENKQLEKENKALKDAINDALKHMGDEFEHHNAKKRLLMARTR